MNRFRHTYSCFMAWLSLLGTLVLQAACSSVAPDVETARKPAAEDGTVVTIQTRAMNNEGDVDHYIGGLRLIITKEGEEYNVCFNDYFERKTAWMFESKRGYEAIVSDDESYLTISVPLGDRGTGVYHFYLIANEEGYVHSGLTYDKPLTNTLNDVTSAISADEVEQALNSTALHVKYAGSLHQPSSPYMLMTASERYVVYAGRENRIGTIQLVRTMARVDFKIQNNVPGEGLTFSDVTLKGNAPGEIYVMQPSVFTPNSTNTGETVLAAKATAGTAVTFYLPERILSEADENSKDKALQLSFTATDAYGRKKTYTDQIYVGPYEAAGGDYAGYNICRNTYYTITARLNSWTEMPYIETTVKPWKYKTYEEDYNMNYSVTVTLPATGCGQEVSGYVFSEADAVLTFTVTNILPDDAECTAQIDPVFDSIVTGNFKDYFSIDVQKTTDADTGKAVYTFAVKPGIEADDKSHTLALFLNVNGDRYPIHQCNVKYAKEETE